MRIEPYRWRLTPSFVAHLWKATTGLSHLSRPEERWPRFAAELVVQTTIDELVETLALVRLDFIKRISSALPLARSLAVPSA